MIYSRFLFVATLLLLLSNQSKAQDKKYAKFLIDTLAADGMLGRGYVKKGDLLAANFISSEFEKNKVQKVGKSYFQPFNLSVNTFQGEILIKIDNKDLIPGVDFMLHPESKSAAGVYTLNFPPVKVFEDSLSFLDFASNETDFSKTVFVIDLDQSAQKNKMNFFINRLNGMNIGGIIFLTTGNLTWFVGKNVLTFPVILAKNESIPKNQKLVLMNFSNQFLPDYQSQNVIGFLPSTEKNDSILIFSAHYDHLGKMGRLATYNGANDNASGTAMMLDLAKSYAKQKKRKYNIYFIAFGGEEAGLVGSNFLADNPKFELSKITKMINLDLMGFGEDGIMVVNGNENPNFVNALKSINEKENFTTEVKSRPNAANSDHYPFAKKGVKAIFIYTMGNSKYYHDINDRPETLELNSYEKIYSLIYQFAEL